MPMLGLHNIGIRQHNRFSASLWSSIKNKQCGAEAGLLVQLSPQAGKVCQKLSKPLMTWNAVCCRHCVLLLQRNVVGALCIKVPWVNARGDSLRQALCFVPGCNQDKKFVRLKLMQGQMEQSD